MGVAEKLIYRRKHEALRIEQERVKVQIVDDRSLVRAPGDHLAGVAVDAFLPFVAVLDHEEIAWQVVLAMLGRRLEEQAA